MWPVPGGHAAPPKMRLVCKLSHKNKTVDTEKYYQNTSNVQYSLYTNTHTHTRLTALFRDYPGEPVPER